MFKNVYFLDSKTLALKLHRGEISEEIAFLHFLIYCILLASYIEFPVVVKSLDNVVSWWYQILTTITMSLLQFWGMRLLYATNKKGDGHDFFMRWAVLSLPVGIKVLLLSLGLSMLYGSILGSFAEELINTASSYIWDIIGICFGAILQYMYFKWMQSSFLVAATGEDL